MDTPPRPEECRQRHPDAGQWPQSRADGVASPGYDACTGFIDSVPATITTQGVWCLRKDLATGITSGNAIIIATNNVTIDCNGFKLGGLAAGNASGAAGIYAGSRQNAAVRHCNVRGFRFGLFLQDGAGHLVEDNRLDNNLHYGIYVSGDNNRVRRNAVYDTGGRVGNAYAFGIVAEADVADNMVSGLLVDIAGGGLYGILAGGVGTRVHGNTVSGFVMTATQGGAVGTAYGIFLDQPRMRASGNQVDSGGTSTNGTGIHANYASYCLDNTAGGFATAINASCTGGVNLTLP